MDIGRTAELTLRLQHRHSDGSWSPLEQRTPHDAASIDPERGWPAGTIYVCKACQEEVLVEPLGDPQSEPA
jgi:hypothetical protein